MLKNGKKTGNGFFSVFVLPNEVTTRLFTANIAKKSFKKSTDRNRRKRWMRAVFHKYRGQFDKMDVLIMPRPEMSKLKNYGEFEQALLSLFPAGKE